MYSPLATVQVPGQDTGLLPTGRSGSHLLCRHHNVLTPCSLYRFLVKIPLARFIGSWLKYWTATRWIAHGQLGTHWTLRVPSSVPSSPCSHHLPALQVPGQDTGQLPPGCSRSHLLCRNHHVLTFGHCKGSWSKYRTATH
jgi:hypothetical protein